MTDKTEHGEIDWRVVRRVIVDMVNLNWPSAFIADAARAVGVKENSRCKAVWNQNSRTHDGSLGDRLTWTRVTPSCLG